MTDKEKYIAEDERIRAEIAKKNSEIEELRMQLGNARREYTDALEKKYAEYIGKKVKIKFVCIIYGKRREIEVKGYLQSFKERTHNQFVPHLLKIKKDGTASMQDVSIWDVYVEETITDIKEIK